jgi:cell division cycle 2-like
MGLGERPHANQGPSLESEKSSTKRRRRFGPLDNHGSKSNSLARHDDVVVDDVDESENAKGLVSELLGRRCRSVDCYERLNFIDEGTYGRVFRARDYETGGVYALKQVKLAGEREGFPVTALREVTLLLSLRHDNIVHVREVVVGSTMDKIYMVMEYAEHDVRSVLERMKHPYSQSEVKSLVLQILRGVAYMHSRWVLHRDLKTSNLLLNHHGVVKVCDFGLARRFGDPVVNMTPGVATLWYRAPEVLLGEAKYTSAVDVWSVGCIFAELALGDALFPGQGELDQIAKIFAVLGKPTESNWPGLGLLPTMKRIAVHGPERSELAARLRTNPHSGRTPLTKLGVELVEAMLTPDPARRVTAAEALQHPYFDEAPSAARPHLIQTLPTSHKAGY